MSVTSARYGSYLLCALALVLAGCSRQEETPPAAAAESMESMDSMDSMSEADIAAMIAPEGELRVVAAPDSIEPGRVAQFENDTGCKVEVKIAGSADELVELMASGGPPPSPPGDASWPPPGNAPFDLAIASREAAPRLIRDGTVQPIGLDRIPGYSNLDPGLQQAPWHFVDGKHYGVPWQGRSDLASMIVAGAPHPNCAYQWMERSVTPPTTGDAAN